MLQLDVAATLLVPHQAPPLVILAADGLSLMVTHK